MNLFRGAIAAAVFALAQPVPAAQQSPAGHGGRRNRPPVVSFKAPGEVVVAGPCGKHEGPDPQCRSESPVVNISAAASDPDGDALRYTFSAAGAKLTSDGPNATLDLTGVAPGTYTVTVNVDDGRGGTVTESVKIDVARCNCPAQTFIPLPCPTVSVSCPSEHVNPGTPITFTASVSGGGPYVTPTFDWAVSAGTIKSGQGTTSVTVDTTGLPYNSFLTGTVNVGGYDRSCSTSVSCTTNACVLPLQTRKVDEYGVISVGDEKLRLDNFVVELQNDPSAQAYLICYGGRRGRAGEARRRCERAMNYAVSTRGIEGSRVVTVDGGLREQSTVELWLVPTGAEPPPAAPTVKPRAASPSPNPRATPRPRGRR